MFNVLKVDGPNIMTNKGGICIQAFSYADGGKTHPVSQEDWRRMRDLFVAAPEMLDLLKEVAEHIDDKVLASRIYGIIRKAEGA